MVFIKMINTLRKYVLGFIVMLLFSACAQKATFEWIKVNPEKVNIATIAEPYPTTIRNVSIIIDLKEKENTEFYNNSTGFFSSIESENKVVSTSKYTSPLKNNIAKSRVKHQSKVYSAKSSSNHIKLAPLKHKAVIDSPADKLNGALKLPLKPIKVNNSTTNQKRNTFNKTAAEIRTMAFNDIKVKNPEIEERSLIKAQKSKSLMWLGVILLVVGGVLGFILNRSAFLIAIAGGVFAVIGYFIRF